MTQNLATMKLYFWAYLTKFWLQHTLVEQPVTFLYTIPLYHVQTSYLAFDMLQKIWMTHHEKLMCKFHLIFFYFKPTTFN